MLGKNRICVLPKEKEREGERERERVEREKQKDRKWMLRKKAAKLD